MKSFNDRLNYAAQFCIRRAGSGNRASTRAFCDTIEWGDGEKLMSELVRRAHKNPTLADGVRLMFDLSSINSAASAFGVEPLPGAPAATGNAGDSLPDLGSSNASYAPPIKSPDGVQAVQRGA